MFKPSVFLLSGLVIGSLVGCGGDEGGTSDATEAEVQSVVASYFQGDGSAACYLTDAGQEQAAAFSGKSPEDCAADKTGAATSPPPELGPVGADDHVAVIMVDFDVANQYLYVLERSDGDWLIDFLGPLPGPDGPATDTEAAESAKDTANEYVEAAEEKDGEKACSLLAPSVLKSAAEVLKRYQRSTIPPILTPPPPPRRASLREKCEFAISNSLYDVGSFSSGIPYDVPGTRHFDYGVGAGDFAVAAEEEEEGEVGSNLGLVRQGDQWLVTDVSVAVQ